MIYDIANLLRAFADQELKALKAAGIRHAPTIGKMYEGLTADILERTLPPGLDLQVVSGFATDDEGHLSGQIDCMLVRGKGIPIPYTDEFKWHVQNIIAVIEVKKNLFSKELADAFEQLRDVLETHSRWIQNVKGGASVDIRPSLRVFAEMTGVIAPSHSKLSELPEELEYIYHTIVGDQFTPIRIAFGYGGFSSETGLRKGFLKFIQDKTLVHGYGPHSFPQLIVAGGASLVKFSGHPYRTPMHDSKMLLLASSRTNPLLLMLELIWTRLTYIQSMPELFGDDLKMEGFVPLLWAKVMENPAQPGQLGWALTAENISRKSLESSPISVNWEPTILTNKQFVIVSELSNESTVDITEEDFISFATESGQSVAEFVDGLIETRLIARSGNELSLITERCVTAILPDGRYIAADDNTGRLTRWITRFMENHKKNTEEKSSADE